MGALRLTTLAAVIAGFLIAPAALLAAQPSVDSSLSSTEGSAGYGTDSGVTAAPSATGQAPLAAQQAATASLRTSSAPEQQAVGSSAAEVTIGDFFFRPQDITITVGETVTWTNDGSVPEGHTVTGNGFDSGVLKKGDTYDHTFNTAGTFDYVCTIHPNMRGTVTVTGTTPSGGGGGGGGSSSATKGSGSTSGSVPSTTPTQSTTPAATPTAPASDSGSGGSLAQTGLNLILLAEIGGCLIATGLLIRRLVYGRPT